MAAYFDEAYLKANRERIEELQAHFRPGGKYNPRKKVSTKRKPRVKKKARRK